MINYKRQLFIAIIFLISAFQCLGQVEELRRDLTFLADSVGNRYPGSAGDLKVREYIARQFTSIGMEYEEQYFDIVEQIWGDGSLRLVADGTVINFASGDDFVVRGRSANDSLSAEYVVVLDSLPDASRSIMLGKAVVCLSRGRVGRTPTIHEMERAGALAVIYVHPAGKGLGSGVSKGGRNHEPYKIPVLTLSHDALARFLPQTVVDTLTTNVYVAPPSHLIQLTSRHHEKRIKSANIIGLKRGSNDEYIIVGAHYDTISPDPGSGEFRRGANDNASGVTLMMALARRLCQTETSHNILFVAFGGEEKGRLGSMYFTSRMPLGENAVTEMINLDMLGRMENQRLYYKQINSTKINLSNRECTKLFLTEGQDAASDHYDFAMKGIPVSYFSTGEDPAIHTSSDTSDRINYEGISLALDFLIEYVIGLDKRR